MVKKYVLSTFIDLEIFIVYIKSNEISPNNTRIYILCIYSRMIPN